MNVSDATCLRPNHHCPDDPPSTNQSHLGWGFQTVPPSGNPPVCQSCLHTPESPCQSHRPRERPQETMLPSCGSADDEEEDCSDGCPNTLGPPA